jgi:hypothetical protein
MVYWTGSARHPKIYSRVLFKLCWFCMKCQDSCALTKQAVTVLETISTKGGFFGIASVLPWFCNLEILSKSPGRPCNANQVLAWGPQPHVDRACLHMWLGLPWDFVVGFCRGLSHGQGKLAVSVQQHYNTASCTLLMFFEGWATHTSSFFLPCYKCISIR